MSLSTSLSLSLSLGLSVHGSLEAKMLSLTFLKKNPLFLWVCVEAVICWTPGAWGPFFNVLLHGSWEIKGKKHSVSVLWIGKWRFGSKTRLCQRQALTKQAKDALLLATLPLHAVISYSQLNRKHLWNVGVSISCVLLGSVQGGRHCDFHSTNEKRG